MNFEYVKNAYGVPAELHREVIVDGKKGVITQDMGNYIGVNFYDKQTYEALPCHPTWEVQYLETFNHKPPVLKITASKKRYMDYIRSDSGLSFSEWLGITRKLILILLLASCQEHEIKIIPVPMTYSEVLTHTTGTHEIRYEKHTNGYLLHLPDGFIGIVSRDDARRLCVVFAGPYCDYKQLN